MDLTEMKNDYEIAWIAHEIRNPLTTIKGFLQLLKPDLMEIGKQQYVELALEEINRANRILHEYLHQTKPSTPSIHKESVNQFLKDIAVLYEGEAVLRGIKLISTYSNEDTMLNLNKDQLKQIVGNIVKNAMESMEENFNETKALLLSTTVTEDYYSIIIEDSGCGMTKDILNHLFVPFHSTKEAGTGIGLTICKELIEKMSGRILVKSTPGKGSTFTLSFPKRTNM